MGCDIIKFINKFKLICKLPIKIINRIILTIPCSWHTKAKLFCNYYTKVIYYTLGSYFQEDINDIKYSEKGNSHINSGIIWIFWWQGMHNMPLIVKKCLYSIKDHSNGHRVILITKRNIKKYTNIPSYIYIKLYNHEMTLTHFSDILRFNLLNNHGGLWIDSTVYCTANLSNNYFTDIYTSGNYNIEQSHKCFSGKWTEFLIGGKSHEKIFSFMNEFFNLYWKNNNYLIDYFLVDYGLNYVYNNNISGFRTYVDNVACKNNPKLYYLADYLNNKYNLDIYKKITKDTNLFKLTYKKKFDRSKGTFYNKLINNELY